jgi:hypothetical protein
LYRTTVAALFLVVSLDLNLPVNASKGSFTSHSLCVPEGEQRSASVLGNSQQADQHNLSANDDKLVLTDGTPVHLKFVRAVVSSRVIAGEKVTLEVVEPVLVGNLVAIPQHSQAEAIVTMAQAKRSLGRGGNLELKIDTVRLADGEIVPVRASKDAKDAGKQVAANGGAAQPRAIYWLAATFIFDFKGKNATIPAGTEITTYIAGDFPLGGPKFQTTNASPREKEKPQ